MSLKVSFPFSCLTSLPHLKKDQLWLGGREESEEKGGRRRRRRVELEMKSYAAFGGKAVSIIAGPESGECIYLFLRARERVVEDGWWETGREGGTAEAEER